MIHAAEILTELRWRGVSIAVDGDTLCLRPRRALNDGLLARIREAKPAILEVLRQPPSSCEANSARIPVAATCWHCGGSHECNCSTCGLMKPSVVWAAGECVACKPRKVRVQ